MGRAGSVQFEAKFEPRDAWVGLFWDRRVDGLHVYVCLVPFLVLHFVKPPTGDAAKERGE
jgi:hypothetical protein